MSKYYPAFLNLADKDVLVIGGGNVAFRKTTTLIECAAKVSVVSPKVNRPLASLALRKKIRLYRRKFSPKDLAGRELVFCATNDEDLNRRVSKECGKTRIWVNVADRPALCGFIVPATVRRGDVTFAVSTGGASPALAVFLKERMDKFFGEEIGGLAKVLKKSRRKILEMALARRQKFLAQLLNDRTLLEIRKKGISIFEKRLENALRM